MSAKYAWYYKPLDQVKLALDQIQSLLRNIDSKIEERSSLKKDTLASLIERIDRAVMLMETGWMDVEPMPCELAAREELWTVKNGLQSLQQMEN